MRLILLVVLVAECGEVHAKLKRLVKLWFLTETELGLFTLATRAGPAEQRRPATQNGELSIEHP